MKKDEIIKCGGCRREFKMGVIFDALCKKCRKTKEEEKIK